MELWIRSQDKLDLIKCTSIHIEEAPGVDEVAIKTFNYGDKYTYVGYYKTKERALEVLDEIQNMIHYEYNFENLTYEKADLILKGKIVENIVKFYEMPKE